MILPREIPTPDNKAPVVRALAALLMVISILAAVTRIVTRLISVSSLKLDDWLACGATFVAIVQSIMVIVQGANGLGKHHDVLNDNQVSTILKSQYAADALFILGLMLAKISATRTIWHMTPRKKRNMVLMVEGIIVAWAVSSIVTSFFQCSMPEPWDYVHGQCFSRGAFWSYVDAANIATDVTITLIMIELFRNLQTSSSKKALVICVFGSRVFIIPAVVCHIYYYNRAVDSADATFEMWGPVVILQVVQCVSIITTCVPYLKPFLDSLESGQMSAGDLLQRTKNSASRSKSGPSPHASRNRGTSRSRGIKSITTLASNVSNQRKMYEMMDMDKSGGGSSSVMSSEKPKSGGTMSTATAKYEPGSSWDGQSHTSQTVLVHQTWRVDVERKNGAVETE